MKITGPLCCLTWVRGMTQAPNDKEEIVPILEMLAAQPQTLETVAHLIADTSFFSAKKMQA